MSVASNYHQVMARIAAAAERVGRAADAVGLVVVTKTVPTDRIREAIKAGATICGENRVQEAKEKIESIGDLCRWHLIGRLQSNKAKYAVKLFDLIHSVDSIGLAIELDRQAAKIGKTQEILIEVSLAGERQKGGVLYDDAIQFVRAVAQLPNISVRGLMTVPPYSANPEDVRQYFRRLSELRNTIMLARIPGVAMNELSMGMSGDFEVAIEEGATLVRVGSAIFGARA